MWARQTALQSLLPSNPTGFSPFEKPSTGCGAERCRNNTNAWITGREAHHNAGSSANATLIYSKTQDEPKTYTHIPSEAGSKTCTIPTPGCHHGGTSTQLATVSVTGLQWPLPSILDYRSTGRGPPSVSGRNEKSH